MSKTFNRRLDTEYYSFMVVYSVYSVIKIVKSLLFWWNFNPIW